MSALLASLTRTPQQTPSLRRPRRNLRLTLVLSSVLVEKDAALVPEREPDGKGSEEEEEVAHRRAALVIE